MALDPSRVVAELRELQELTGVQSLRGLWLDTLTTKTLSALA